VEGHERSDKRAQTWRKRQTARHQVANAKSLAADLLYEGLPKLNAKLNSAFDGVITFSLPAPNGEKNYGLGISPACDGIGACLPTFLPGGRLLGWYGRIKPYLISVFASGGFICSTL